MLQCAAISRAKSTFRGGDNADKTHFNDNDEDGDDDNPIWKICVCGVETVQGCFFVTRPNTDRIFKICGGGAMVVVYIPWYTMVVVYQCIPW